MATYVDDVDNPAVLDKLSDTRLRMDGYPFYRRFPESISIMDRAYQYAVADYKHRLGSVYRHRLHLLTFHDIANLRHT